MALPKLFPDEAELVERDAADLYREGLEAAGIMDGCRYEDLLDGQKTFFRLVAQNPYQLATRPRR